ncbi:MAG: protein serine/threonine phosphatase 2C family protein [Verrucomicrobia bacterium]|nr:protein serine/threonine phosphatase 2C family protein [Verrucomicrobiota bacterium]
MIQVGAPLCACEISRRVALLGASVFYATKAVYHVALSCISHLGYLFTLKQWELPRHWSITELQAGKEAASISYSRFCSLLSLHPERPKGVANKLEKQFACAQNQAAQERDKAFRYLEAPADFPGHAHPEHVPGYEVGVCHFIGRRPSMEDEHLATSFNLISGQHTYPIQLFGVFDGHGGGEASRFVKDHLEDTLHKALREFCPKELTDEGIWHALKATCDRLDREFGKRKSGTTAVISMLLNGRLWTANVGDSRAILDSGIQLSEDAKPSDPRYLKGIQKLGGNVIAGRVNGCLAVARAIGDNLVGAVSAQPKITVCNAPKGHLILTCDGIYDVSSTRQVAEAVRAHGELSSAQLAKNLVYSAFAAGSTDNLTALVIKL